MNLHELADRAEEIPGLSEALAELMLPVLEAAEAQADEYEDFHWGEQVEGASLLGAPEVWPGMVLVKLGELVSVVYETSKGGEVFHWEHEFDGDLPILAATLDQELVIVGGSYTVTERGIVG